MTPNSTTAGLASLCWQAEVTGLTSCIRLSEPVYEKVNIGYSKSNQPIFEQE